jgi:hypothetical protein
MQIGQLVQVKDELRARTMLNYDWPAQGFKDLAPWITGVEGLALFVIKICRRVCKRMVALIHDNGRAIASGLSTG